MNKNIGIGILGLVLLAAPGARSAPEGVAAAAPAKSADYQEVSFDTLGAFKFDVPMEFDAKGFPKKKQPKIKDKIPESITALSGKKVAIRGFMLPLDGGEKGLSQFILMANQITCCFGDANRVNGFIMVTMAPGKLAKPIEGVPVTAYGSFDVGPVFEDGMLREIYRMKAEDVH